MKLFLSLLLLAMVAGCTEYACVNGERYKKEWPTDGLWHKQTGPVTCSCEDDKGKPIPCAEKP